MKKRLPAVDGRAAIEVSRYAPIPESLRMMAVVLRGRWLRDLTPSDSENERAMGWAVRRYLSREKRVRLRNGSVVTFKDGSGGPFRGAVEVLG